MIKSANDRETGRKRNSASQNLSNQRNTKKKEVFFHLIFKIAKVKSYIAKDSVVMS